MGPDQQAVLDMALRQAEVKSARAYARELAEQADWASRQGAYLAAHRLQQLREEAQDVLARCQEDMEKAMGDDMGGERSGSPVRGRGRSRSPRSSHRGDRR